MSAGGRPGRCRHRTGSGAFAVALDLRAHEAAVEHSDGRAERIPLAPDRSVRAVTHDVLGAVAQLAGSVRNDPTPPETAWTTPLDEDDEHATYDPDRVLRTAHVAPRAPAPRAWPPRSSRPRGAGDAEEVAVGWWPGDPRHPRAAFIAYASPAPEGLAAAPLSPAASHWDETLSEFVLDWDDVRASPDPRAAALEFGRAAVLRGGTLLGWDPALSELRP